MRFLAFIAFVLIAGFFVMGSLFGSATSSLSNMADFKPPSKRELMNIRLSELDNNTRKMYDGCRKSSGYSSDSKLPCLCVSSQMMPKLSKDMQAALIEAIAVPQRNGKLDEERLQAIAKKHRIGAFDAVSLLTTMGGALRACEKAIG